MPNIDANDIDVGIPTCSTIISLNTNIITNNVVDNTHDSVSKVFASFFIINLFRWLKDNANHANHHDDDGWHE